MQNTGAGASVTATATVAEPCPIPNLSLSPRPWTSASRPPLTNPVGNHRRQIQHPPPNPGRERDAVYGVLVDPFGIRWIFNIGTSQ